MDNSDKPEIKASSKAVSGQTLAVGSLLCRSAGWNCHAAHNLSERIKQHGRPSEVRGHSLGQPPRTSTVLKCSTWLPAFAKFLCKTASIGIHRYIKMSTAKYSQQCSVWILVVGAWMSLPLLFAPEIVHMARNYLAWIGLHGEIARASFLRQNPSDLSGASLSETFRRSMH